VQNHLKRMLCAALALGLMPGIAAAEDPGQERQYSAIATGLAIPVGARPVERVAPAERRGRSVLIDAASATLYMLEDGDIVDSMKVIVGKPSAATPELKTALTYATLNPYWHVPTDIARTLTAPNVLKHGTRYLEERGYEVVSSFRRDAEILDPHTVDWKAVAEGRERVFVRQRPGPANSMGRMKFSLLNGEGIFLHDTPMKDLFEQDERNLSAGCVRLEDAERFAQWLLGGELPVQVESPEQRIALRQMVPVTITYLDPQTQTQLAALR
jgi:murein L,D-transpeptidase YcbB/YkuD